MTKTLNCEDCGAEAPARRANAKYCDLCRIARFFSWIKLRTYKCLICKEPYAPTRRDDVLCGTCDINFRKSAGTCAFCEKESKQLIADSIKVCRPCATTPDNREQLWKLILKKQSAAIL